MNRNAIVIGRSPAERPEVKPVLLAIARAAWGLFVHGLRRPPQPARLCRRCGRVRPS